MSHISVNIFKAHVKTAHENNFILDFSQKIPQQKFHTFF